MAASCAHDKTRYRRRWAAVRLARHAFLRAAKISPTQLQDLSRLAGQIPPREGFYPGVCSSCRIAGMNSSASSSRMAFS